MRPLRYSINVTLDGGVHHEALTPDEELHRHFAGNLGRADALLFGYGPTLLARLRERLELELVGRQEFAMGAAAQRYRPRRVAA